MEHAEAVDLLRDAVSGARGIWADLGAGTGTFTRALADLLDDGSRIYAVDEDAGALRAFDVRPMTNETRMVPVAADFSRQLELPGLGDGLLDGILLANALHFVRDVEGTLRRLVARIRAGGRVIIVEYDRRAASRWVPHPIPASRWPSLAATAGLVDPKITATTPSAYSGILCVGAATKP